MSRVLITGGSGLLGLNLAVWSQAQGYEVCAWSNQHSLTGVPFQTEQVDLLDRALAAERLRAFAPDIIIHCAAMADIDLAEQNPELAFQLNGTVPGLLAAEAQTIGAKFVHISTDAVFDGTAGDYRETDAPSPISAYARSKLAGEQAVAAANPDAIIARVNFYGWSASGRRSLAEFFFNNLSAGRSVNGFTDVIFTPLYVGDLAQLLLHMAESKLSGLYHVFSQEAISKYNFGVRLARAFGLDETLIHPETLADSGLNAPRALNLSMNTERLSAALSLRLPDQEGGLRALLRDYRGGYPAKLASFFI